MNKYHIQLDEIAVTPLVGGVFAQNQNHSFSPQNAIVWDN
jgi:hypothetical protein